MFELNWYLQASHWVDEGMVKSIRGVTFSTRVSPQIANRMIYAARGVFNRFIPDVHIFTDHRSGPAGGRYNLDINQSLSMNLFCPVHDRTVFL